MSGGGFHVHGPHEHHVEHIAQHGAEDRLSSVLAVVTAILSTVGALFAYQAGSTQNAAILYKNNAAIKKTEASNQWNYYQAKSSKQNLAELGQSLPGINIEFYRKEIARYKEEKESIRKEAEKLELVSKDWDKKSDHEMHLHHRWAQAMTFLQVSIALAAITLLTRKRWLNVGVYVAAGIGTLLGVWAMLETVGV